MSGIYRYPGIQPFSQDERSVFFGREDDIVILFNSILLNQSTVLVGKSGIGKTSLIYAGIKPLIEEKINLNEADKRCIMFAPVRIGSWSPGDKQTLMDKLQLLQFDENENRLEEKPLAPFLPQSLRSSLWFRLKQLQYRYRQHKREVTNLIIFDQLEELFTYPHQQFKELLVHLKEVVSTNLPDNVRIALEEQDVENNDLLNDDEYEILYSSVPVKFLFAIRSDKLSLIMRLRHVLPDLLQQSYEIRPLTKAQAKKAITGPANFPGEFLTAPFTITDATADYITDFLFNLPDNDLENNYEEHKIEPFTLQIICTHIERKVAPTDEDSIINTNEIPQPQHMISDYYKTVLKDLNLDEQMELKVRMLIEEKMIYEEDQRKLILYKEIIVKEYGISESLLLQLTRQRLLKEITSTGIKSSYEIGHDWLVIPILMAKRERLGAVNEVAGKIDESLRLLNEQIEKSPGNYMLYQQRASYYNLINNYNSAIEDYTKALQLKGTEDVDILLARAYSYMLQGDYENAKADYVNINRLDPVNYLSCYNLGVLHFDTGNSELAKHWFLQTIKINPGYSDALNYLGHIEESANNLKQAKEYYKEGIRSDERNYRPMYNLGLMYYKEQNWLEATDCFKQTIDINPKYSDAYYNLGLIASENGDVELETDYYLKAIEADNSNALPRYNLGVNCYKKGEKEKAKQYFLDTIAISNSHSNALNYLGLIDELDGNRTMALDYYIKACAADPSNILPVFNLGIFHFDNNATELAKNYFIKVLEIDPSYAAALNYLGIIELANGNKQIAFEYYTKAIEADATNYRPYYNLGKWYYDENRLPEAELNFKKATEINTSYSSAFYYLGLIASENEDKDAALGFYQKAIETDNTYYLAHYNMGVIYYYKNRIQEATNHFLKVVEINPDYSDALNYLGSIEKINGNLEMAYSYFIKAVAAYDANFFAWYNLADVQQAKGELKLAIENFKKYEAAYPNDWEVYFHLGQCYAETDIEIAKAYLQKALKLQPDNAEVARMISELQSKSNNA